MLDWLRTNWFEVTALAFIFLAWLDLAVAFNRFGRNVDQAANVIGDVLDKHFDLLRGEVAELRNRD